LIWTIFRQFTELNGDPIGPSNDVSGNSPGGFGHLTTSGSLNTTIVDALSVEPHPRVVYSLDAIATSAITDTLNSGQSQVRFSAGELPTQ
jgi:hypothetical protein